MKLRKLAALLLCLAMALSLAACGGGSAQTGGDEAPAGNEEASGGEEAAAGGEEAASGGEEAGDQEYNISVILKTTASEYWGYVVAGAEAYEKDHPNVHVNVKGATSETAYDEQQNMIETDMANASIDGYVIAPLQADMVANMISGQTKPIVAVDTDIDAPEVLAFVGTGNESAGALGGAAAAQLAKERGWEEIKCIEIAGVQGDSTNESRMAGYAAGIESEGGEFLYNEVQYANAEANQAVACMEAIMQNHPEGIAVICANNDDMAMAAARAAAGNDAYANTVFLGFDGIQSACNSILAGEETMSVCQEGYNMGYNSVDAVIQALQGATLDRFIDAGASVVGPDTAQARLEQLQGYLA